MKELQSSKIYPLLAIAFSLFIIVFGLITAKDIKCLFFLGGTYVMLAVFGCIRACVRVLPFTLLMSVLFAGISYAVTRNASSSYAMAFRLLAVGIAVIPAMSIRPVDLTRNLAQLHVPRAVTLGMLIALSFLPLLRLEIRRIREAMKTRGAGNALNPKIFYRALLIPLVMRLVNISDTLSLSVETRGFTLDKNDVTVYKRVKPKWTDFVMLLLLVLGAVLTVVL